jgi:superfamily II DNA/RNA helicase
VLAQAQSGQGKTATFLIGALERIDESSNEQQVLVILPTRELANQIYEDAVELSKMMKIKVALLIGGGSQMIERQRLQEHC